MQYTNQKSYSKRKNNSQPGRTYFEVQGYARNVNKGKKDFYVDFDLLQEGKEKSDIINVVIPFDLGCVPDEGDHVIIKGTMRSIWLKDCPPRGKFLLELVAEEVALAEEVDPL